MTKSCMRSIALSIILFLLVLLCLRLSSWQHDRWLEKKHITAMLQQEGHREPEQMSKIKGALPPFRRVALSGKWLNKKQFLLANQMRDGHYGYDVITPFQLNNGKQWVLIDRGWVPATEDYQAQDISISQTETHLVAYVFYPSSRHFVLGSVWLDPQGWPQKVQILSTSLLAQRLNDPVLPFVLRLESPHQDAYATDWPLLSFPASRHLSYMIQWLLFAALLLLGAVLVMVKERRKR